MADDEAEKARRAANPEAGPGTSGLSEHGRSQVVGLSNTAVASGAGVGGAGQPRGDWNYAKQLDRIERVLGLLVQAVASLTNTTNKILGQELSISKKESEIMAAVQVEQDDIDAVGVSLEALVTEVNNIDTTQLPQGTLDGLHQAATDLAEAINAKLPVTAPVTPPEAPAAE